MRVNSVVTIVRRRHGQGDDLLGQEVFIHGSRLPDEEGEGVANNIRDLGFAVEWANARRPVRVSHPVSVLVGGSW